MTGPTTKTTTTGTTPFSSTAAPLSPPLFHRVLSHRSEKFATKTPSYLAKHFEALTVTKQYDPAKNPSGIITCCIAENNLTLDLLVPQLKKIFKLIGDASLPLTLVSAGQEDKLEGRDTGNFDSSIKNEALNVATGYQDMMGIPIFRDTLATFISEFIFKGAKSRGNNSNACNSHSEKNLDNHNNDNNVDRGVDINAETDEEKSNKIKGTNLCVSSGVGAILNSMAHALFNPGDVVIIPAPYYANFVFDFGALAGIRIVALHSELNEQNLNKLCDEVCPSLGEGERIAGLILTNPHNPLGTIYTKECLKSVIKWANTNDIHVISDEIYALSVYNNKPVEFHSVYEILEGELGDYVHILWGFSKDICLGGYRVGVMCSQNRTLLEAMSSIAYFCAVSNPTQIILTNLLQDEQFMNLFLQENRRRLKEACDECINFFKEHDIIYTKPSGGMFIWVNLSNYLLEGESEDDMFDCLSNEPYKLLLTPGASNETIQPGLFRLCFAFNNLNTTKE